MNENRQGLPLWQCLLIAVAALPMAYLTMVGLAVVGEVGLVWPW